MRRFTTDTLLSEVGNTLGTSEWHQIDQQMIDTFAVLSGDQQWIHKAGPRADQGPYRGAIAHGFLTLSLLIPMLNEVFQVDDVELTLNRGIDRLQFTSPVPAGARVRATVVLTSAKKRPRGYSEAVFSVTVDIEEHTTPAYRVDSTILYKKASCQSVNNNGHR